MVDNTGGPAAFSVPGNTSTDAVFPVAKALAGKKYRFVRVRIKFHLDSTQTSSSPVPFVEKMVVHYDFND